MSKFELEWIGAKVLESVNVAAKKSAGKISVRP